MSTAVVLAAASGPDSPPPPRRVVRPGVLPSSSPKHWLQACPLGTLLPGRGVAVLLPDDAQAAVFLMPNGMLYAVDNLDPYSGAAVLARGLTGDRAGEPTVASPLFKQRFSLRTGEALDDPAVRLTTYAVRVLTGTVLLGIERQQAREASHAA